MGTGDKKSSGKGAASCTTCNTPPRCFHQYTIQDKTGTVVLDHPKTHKTKLSVISVIQDTKSASYTFKLKGQCQHKKEQCPKTIAPIGQLLFGTNQKNAILCYSDNYDFKNMTLLRWLKEFFVFRAQGLKPVSYILPVTECKGVVQVATLKVYPDYKMTIKLAYGKEISAAKIEDRKWLYQYTEAESTRLRRDVAKPWSQINKTLVTVDTANSLSADAKIGEFKEKISVKFRENERYSDDNPIFKITSVISKLSDSLMSGRGNIGPVRDIQLIGPNLEFSGIKELKKEGDAVYFEYSLNGSLAPLIGVKVIIDLIDVLLQCINAVLPSAGSVAAKGWRELRTAMDNAKKNFNNNTGAGYITAGVDLICTGEFGNCTISVYNDANKRPAGRAEGGAKLMAQIKGYIEGGIKTWALKGSLEASATASTGIGGSALVDPKGIGVRWEHDGAKIEFVAGIKAGTVSYPELVSYEIEHLIITLASPYKSDPYYIYNFG